MNTDKKQKKNVIAIALIGVALLLGLAGSGILIYRGMLSAQAAKRANTLALARDYIERAEYQRALNLLDALLIENAQDDEVRSLRDKAIEALKQQELSQGSAPKDSEAVSSALKEVSKAVESVAKAASQTAQRTGSTASPQTSETTDAARRKAQEEERAKAEAAAAARAAAEAERRAAEEAEAARRKAQEEELARKSRELQERMRLINDLI
ncbi:MAG: hypothetical protein WHT84_06320, partial [Breznakiellaceae bacterium]